MGLSQSCGIETARPDRYDQLSLPIYIVVGPENPDPINIDILACRGHSISGLMSETTSCGVCSLPDLGYRSPCMGHNFHSQCNSICCNQHRKISCGVRSSWDRLSPRIHLVSLVVDRGLAEVLTSPESSRRRPAPSAYADSRVLSPPRSTDAIPSHRSIDRDRVSATSAGHGPLRQQLAQYACPPAHFAAALQPLRSTAPAELPLTSLGA